jgi:hypothetical protein
MLISADLMRCEKDEASRDHWRGIVEIMTPICDPGADCHGGIGQ